MRLSLLLFMLTTLLFSGCKLFGGDDDSSDPVAAAETLRRSNRLGKAPDHRQTRRGAPPIEMRMGGANDPCEVAGIIESDISALVFRNVGELATPMSLNVLAALSVSGGGMGSAAEQNAILQSMFDTFDDPSMVNSVSNTTIPLSPRLTEAGMDPATCSSRKWSHWRSSTV